MSKFKGVQIGDVFSTNFRESGSEEAPLRHLWKAVAEHWKGSKRYVLAHKIHWRTRTPVTDAYGCVHWFIPSGRAGDRGNYFVFEGVVPARTGGRGPKLWKDISEEERMTERLIRQCLGAKDPKWLARHLKRLRTPICPAAVFWYGFDKYMPCGLGLVKGTGRCCHHQ